jgi:hypothetical protein
MAVAAAMLAGPAQAQVSFESIGEDAALLVYFGKMDANRDGMVSDAEFRTFHQTLFISADSDKNGHVTLQEMMQQKEREKTAMFQGMLAK